ncbi:MAG: hypothetical protein NC339_06540 [Muribaculaceae bacterium]|nr:hypothetical protein [Muribaculaceae bacterium]
MKKIIIATSVLLSSLFAGQAFAQTPCTDQATCKAAQEQCQQQRPCPFDGLNLTAEQQAKLKEITPCTSDKKDKKDKQDIKKECRENAKAARQEYLTKIKAILTPEQYVQYLENSYVNQAPRHKVRPDAKKGVHKGDKACMQRKAERAQTAVVK